jgi:hypothetical protein
MRSGARHRTVFAEAITPKLRGRDVHPRAQFAYQSLIGVLVHATLIHPEPLHLGSNELEPELARMAERYLCEG